MLEMATDRASERQANIAHSERMSDGAPQLPVQLCGATFMNAKLAGFYNV